ncbi:hypothetical protein, partial [Staphylococcus epidermidis]|uniref:hypothetical protein n=1 Tax=Staphylococcus epidermidis TaxID=1282 RepID=UPI0027382F25
LDPTPPWMPAVLGQSLGAIDRREAFLRATARWRDDGRLEVDPAAQQDSSMFAVFARADCLVRHPAFAPDMPAGAPVTVLPLGSGSIRV